VAAHLVLWYGMRGHDGMIFIVVSLFGVPGTVLATGAIVVIDDGVVQCMRSFHPDAHENRGLIRRSEMTESDQTKAEA
jgi:hypothetical protein